MCFINFSNHSSANWSSEQLAAAREFGEVIDYPFPAVPSEADSSFVAQLALECAQGILAYNPKAVMCQGEFTLTYGVIELLKKSGIVVLAACSERKTVETIMPDGSSKKTSEFKFVRFREYGGVSHV